MTHKASWELSFFFVDLKGILEIIIIIIIIIIIFIVDPQGILRIIILFFYPKGILEIIIIIIIIIVVDPLGVLEIIIIIIIVVNPEGMLERHWYSSSLDADSNYLQGCQLQQHHSAAEITIEEILLMQLNLERSYTLLLSSHY